LEKLRRRAEGLAVHVVDHGRQEHQPHDAPAPRLDHGGIRRGNAHETVIRGRRKSGGGLPTPPARRTTLRDAWNLQEARLQTHPSMFDGILDRSTWTCSTTLLSFLRNRQPTSHGNTTGSTDAGSRPSPVSATRTSCSNCPDVTAGRPDRASSSRSPTR